MIAGPEGFDSGPHAVDWVRADYPRGTIVSLLKFSDTRQMTGHKLAVEDGKLVLEPFQVGGGTPPAAAAPDSPAPEST
jgi:hypothetical protein